jgi:hypothetical protein
MMVVRTTETSNHFNNILVWDWYFCFVLLLVVNNRDELLNKFNLIVVSWDLRCFGMLRTVCLPIFKGQPAWSLKVGPIGFPETSVNNYEHELCNILEEGRPELHGGGSLKSRITVCCGICSKMDSDFRNLCCNFWYFLLMSVTPNRHNLYAEMYPLCIYMYWKTYSLCFTKAWFSLGYRIFTLCLQFFIVFFSGKITPAKCVAVLFTLINSEFVIVAISSVGEWFELRNTKDTTRCQGWKKFSTFL